MTYFQSAKNQGEADARTMRVVHAGDVGVSTNVINQVDVNIAGADIGLETTIVGTVPLPTGAATNATLLDIETNTGELVKALESVGIDTLMVKQVSGAADSVYIVGGAVSGTQYTERVAYDEPATYNAIGFYDDTAGIFYPANYTTPLPVADQSDVQYLEGEVDASPQGNAIMLRDSNVDSHHGAIGNQGYVNSGTLRVVHATDVGMSVRIISNATGTQYTDRIVYDENPTVTAIGFLDDGNDGAIRVVGSGDGALPVSDAVASGSLGEIELAMNNLIGALEGGFEVMAVRQVSGAADSVYVTGASGTLSVVGSVVADAADDGSAPVQIGGIARTANPTAVSGGDVVKGSYDDLGRTLTRPIQVRDLIKTAYVSVTNGTETTLRAAVAGAYLDCIMVVGSNNSDAAVSVDIRAVTGGNVIHTLRIPANSTAGWTPQVPWPQDETGNNWTVDGPDETGRTLTFSALFSQEI